MNFRFLFIALLILASFTACQKEEDVIIDPTDNSESFNGTSNFAASLLSATQNDGSADNLIDGTSCFSIDFPVDVVANGQQVTLNSIEDLQLVEDIFNLFIGDTVRCSFPGYVRGLAFDGQYYYVGQSEDMYTSQNFGGNNFTTMCNAGIYKVDVEENISRFVGLYENMNIHDIIILN